MENTGVHIKHLSEGWGVLKHLSHTLFLLCYLYTGSVWVCRETDCDSSNPSKHEPLGLSTYNHRRRYPLNSDAHILRKYSRGKVEQVIPMAEEFGRVGAIVSFLRQLRIYLYFYYTSVSDSFLRFGSRCGNQCLWGLSMYFKIMNRWSYIQLFLNLFNVCWWHKWEMSGANKKIYTYTFHLRNCQWVFSLNRTQL